MTVADDALPDVEVLDLFVIDEQGRLATAEPWQRRPAPTPPQPKVTREPRPAPLSPTPRRGPVTTAAGAAPAASVIQKLGRRDVRRAVFVDPLVAHELLGDGTRLGAIAGLDLLHPHPHVEGPTLTWDATVRTGRWRRRAPAELCVHPSRSWVVTVLELRPKQPRRLSGARFLQAGFEITDRIGAELTRAAR